MHCAVRRVLQKEDEIQRNVENKHYLRSRKKWIEKAIYTLIRRHQAINYLSFYMISELRAILSRNSEAVSFKRLQCFKVVDKSRHRIIPLMFVLWRIQWYMRAFQLFSQHTSANIAIFKWFFLNLLNGTRNDTHWYGEYKQFVSSSWYHFFAVFFSPTFGSSKSMYVRLLCNHLYCYRYWIILITFDNS